MIRQSEREYSSFKSQIFTDVFMVGGGGGGGGGAAGGGEEGKAYYPLYNRR